MNCSSLLNIYTFLAILLFSTLYLTWNAYDTSYCILSDSLESSASVDGYYVGSQNDGSYSRKDSINILFQFPDFFQLHELKSTTSTASTLYPSDYHIITKIQIKSDGNANYYLWGIVHLEPSKSTMVYIAYNDKMTDMYEKSFPPTTGWTYLLPETTTRKKRLNKNDYRNHTSSFHGATTRSSNIMSSFNYVSDSNTEDIINTKRNGHNTNLLYTPTLSGSISTSPLTCTCYGTPSVMSKNSNRQLSNIYLMLHHPATTLFIIIMCYIAFYIWQNHIDTSILTLSYDNIFTSQQYYRIITASVCHFDLLHLGFNMYALYQLMEVESVYNSVKYAYLSMDLIFITVAIYLLIYHVLITKYNQVDLIHSSVVGYSGVVFAWMVAYSATLKQFCPIMFFPSFCFSTYYIIPGFPINLAPILLLFITKFIIPQSSFTGHLAGIIIGYPVTWGLLNWCTPPILITILSIGFIRMKTLYFWKINVYNNDQTNSVLVINDTNDGNIDESNYDGSSHSTTNSIMTRLFKCIRPYISPTDMIDFIPNTTNNSTELNTYYSFIFMSLAFLFILSLSIIMAPLQQVLPRALLMLLVYGTWQYRRCMYLFDRSSSNAVITEQALLWFSITVSVLLCFIFLDSWSFGTSLLNKTYLTSNNNSNNTESLSFYYYSVCIYALLIVNEGMYICHLSAVLHHHTQANVLLIQYRLDWSQLKGVIQFSRCCNCCGCSYCSCCDLCNSSTGNNVRRTYGRGTLLPTTDDIDERYNGNVDNDNNGNTRRAKSASRSKADKTKHNMAVLKDRLKNKGNGNGVTINSSTYTSTVDPIVNDSGSHGIDASFITSSSPSNHFNYNALLTTAIDDDVNHNINNDNGDNNNNSAKQKTKTSPAPSYINNSNINNDNGDNNTVVV